MKRWLDAQSNTALMLQAALLLAIWWQRRDGRIRVFAEEQCHMSEQLGQTYAAL